MDLHSQVETQDNDIVFLFTAISVFGIICQEAALLLQKYRDHDFSYADAVSFAVMKKSGLKSAFAYDSHFVTAGFNL